MSTLVQSFREGVRFFTQDGVPALRDPRGLRGGSHRFQTDRVRRSLCVMGVLLANGVRKLSALSLSTSWKMRVAQMPCSGLDFVRFCGRSPVYHSRASDRRETAYGTGRPNADHVTGVPGGGCGRRGGLCTGGGDSPRLRRGADVRRPLGAGRCYDIGGRSLGRVRVDGGRRLAREFPRTTRGADLGFQRTGGLATSGPRGLRLRDRLAGREFRPVRRRAAPSVAGLSGRGFGLRAGRLVGRGGAGLLLRGRSIRSETLTAVSGRPAPEGVAARLSRGDRRVEVIGPTAPMASVGVFEALKGGGRNAESGC